ncbi:tetratricopeptide repeat protein, partial [Candidatus Aminicenantes bacterium AC-335-G13]|nr:tetratricopeptide repeat protein [Candidatus Aminicenantes bacterium AC-335-G13]
MFVSKSGKGKNSFLSSFLEKLRRKGIIKTIAAFIGGGWLIIEFVHWILVDHYHFPEESVDITIVTLVSALICTLIWRWYRTGETKIRKIKVEFILIPIIIIASAFINILFIFQIEKVPSEANVGRRVKSSIAVLPFKDLSLKRDQEYFCDGMTEAIIARLSHLEGLKVISRTSTMRYKNTDKDIKEIGKELGVATVLEGSIQKERNNIRLIAQLINTKDRFHIWSQTYNRKYKSVFELQDEISEAIANALKFKLKVGRFKGVKSAEPIDVGAYEFYLKGQHLIETKYSFSREEEDFKSAVRMFEKAIEIDPNYALAYWGLGNAYESHYVRKNNQKDFYLMIKNYKRAYEINSDLAETNLGMGWAYFHRENLDVAFKFFRRALEVDPYNSQVNFDAGSFFRSIGLYYQAIKYYSKTIYSDPLNIMAHYLRAVCFINIGEFERTIIYFRKALDIEPNNISLLSHLALCFIFTKNLHEAENILSNIEKTNPYDPRVQNIRARIFAIKGEKCKALALIKGKIPFYYLPTSIYSLLGMKDEA